ncbi:putative ABC transporter [Neospora caninum Liverpool]|uniref:ABC transporter, putative n=1 Tax=Neospora caninum (strain Liverpool) TaxID=572307 RepID=F0VP13_NEOCL|nr:putative ABC transporter [Neospora caninum Liverpool]CBZ55459.1 putative ABC transporter [Neospora caninum Liverpool]CEL70196.1 TPA: ABC transporter, putative [Neospora caninum Liverpool]|eukprot:XP_003885487.1 putative ABC transporter [Neospora caninum Liverpool]
MEAFGAAQYVITLLSINPEGGYCLPRLMPCARVLKQQLDPILLAKQADTEVSPTASHLNDKDPLGEWRARYVHADLEYFEVRGEIHFCSVVFHYPGRPTVPVLNGVSLHVSSKEFVGVAGAAGSGKTTLLRLIDGLVHADQGAVFIDGRDVRHLDPIWLRRQVGVLWQDPDIVSGTIHDNLYYGVGNPDPVPCYSNEVCMRAKELKFTETVSVGFNGVCIHMEDCSRRKRRATVALEVTPERCLRGLH